MTQPKVLGYLPDEKPSLGKLILYAIQQVIVMFPATVTVALITGFQVSTTIFASGLATVCFILITGRKIPMYYGSSFAYLSAISGLIAAQGFVKVDGILPPEAISIAQFGIIASGLVSIAAGLLVRLGGMKMVEKILPATITGPIAMIIGLTLAGNAMMDAAPQAAQSQAVWVVSLITLVSTVIYSRKLKGFLGQLPLLLGALTGCLAAGLLYVLDPVNMNFFRQISQAALDASSWKLGDGSFFALPAFTLPKVSWLAVAAIMPIAIATIPESTAHIYQLDIYVDDLAKKKGRGKFGIEKLLDRNLIGDGICDMVSGAVGGPAGTNYGENISTMAITKVFSVPVMAAAGIFAMVISCLLPLLICVWVYFQPDNLARITAFAVIGIYISFQMVVFAALRQRLQGWKPAGEWTVGRWGMPINILALLYGVSAIYLLAQPAESESFFDQWIVLIGLTVVIGSGLLYMLIAKPYGKSNAPENDAIAHAAAMRAQRQGK